MTRETWLNGWHRMKDNDGNLGDTVLMGTGVYCVGCGYFYGITTVIFGDDWEPPGPVPDWPFDEIDCPLPIHRYVKDLAENPSGIFRQPHPRGQSRLDGKI